MLGSAEGGLGLLDLAAGGLVGERHIGRGVREVAPGRFGRGARLREGNFVIARIEAHQHVVGLDVLVVGDGHLEHGARHAGADRRDVAGDESVVGRDVRARVPPEVTAVGQRREQQDGAGRQRPPPPRRRLPEGDEARADSTGKTFIVEIRHGCEFALIMAGVPRPVNPT